MNVWIVVNLRSFVNYHSIEKIPKKKKEEVILRYHPLKCYVMVLSLGGPTNIKNILTKNNYRYIEL